MAVLSSALLVGDGIQLGRALWELCMTQSNDFWGKNTLLGQGSLEIEEISSSVSVIL
jgi:hypothetical protein